MQTVSVLGSTGSVGVQTLNTIRRLRDKFKVTALAANSNVSNLAKQVNEFCPDTVCLENAAAADKLKPLIPAQTTVVGGSGALLADGIYNADIIVVAVSGFAAIDAVIKAIKLSKRVALATKEVLVAAGGIIMPMAEKYGAQIIPVDSEHSAIFQALSFDFKKPFEKLILTASGGPFLNKSNEQIQNASVTDALSHPNWAMGKKISIDSATMMNKGLEVIEAMRLYNCGIDKVTAVIHPESIIHSMVAFSDGAVMAQMSTPSMEIPIQLALTFPKRLNTGVAPIDFTKLKSLNFNKIDTEKFPCYQIALESARAGGNMPCAMNAANECAVEYFLGGKIKYYKIPVLISEVLSNIKFIGMPDLSELLRTDARSRELAEQFLKIGD